jgi:hypothetical protein
MTSNENISPAVIEQLKQILASSEVKSVAFCSTKRRTWVMEKGAENPLLIKSPANIWQSLADSFVVLTLHNLPLSRLHWVATEGTIAMVHQKNKGTIGILIAPKVAPNQTARLLLQCEQALHKIP